MTRVPLFRVDELKKYFNRNNKFFDTLFRETEYIRAVDNVSFELESNNVTGIIGESGCGKSTLLKTLVGIFEPTEGSIHFKGKKTADFGRKDWKNFRRNAQMIFQDPFNSLDPRMKVRETLLEPLKIHNIGDRPERIQQVMNDVQLDPPTRYLDNYPHELSGGEKQRVSIARALVLKPEILFADEPVSMLDVSTQASILKLLGDIIDDHNMSMVYISHDLSTVSTICDDINVMYLGRFVENAPTRELLESPKHPYSKALIDAIPIPDPYHNRERTQISGDAQSTIQIEEGCRFRNRCPEAMNVCEKTPKYVNCAENRYVACHLYYEHDQINKNEKNSAPLDSENDPNPRYSTVNSTATNEGEEQ